MRSNTVGCAGQSAAAGEKIEGDQRSDGGALILHQSSVAELEVEIEVEQERSQLDSRVKYCNTLFIFVGTDVRFNHIIKR